MCKALFGEKICSTPERHKGDEDEKVGWPIFIRISELTNERGSIAPAPHALVDADHTYTSIA
jgi:hypothetical protein